MIDFIARGPTPGRFIAFRPSAAACQRVADLIAREKTEGLSPDETAELDHYMQLDPPSEGTAVAGTPAVC